MKKICHPVLAMFLLLAGQAVADGNRYFFGDELWQIKLRCLKPVERYRFIEEELNFTPPGEKRDQLLRGQALMREKAGAAAKDSDLDPGKLADDLNYGEAFAWLESRLAEKNSSEEQGMLFYGKALLFYNIGDVDEAYAYAEKAKELWPVNEVCEFLQRLESERENRPTPAAALRQWDRKHGVVASLGLGYEYDTNVVLEQVSPSAPTNKEDGAAVLNLSVAKTALKKKLGMRHQLSYNLYESWHMEHDELDTASHSASWVGSFDQRINKNQLNGLMRLSAMHFESAGSRLLWNWSSGPSFFWYQDNWKTLWNAGLCYQQTSYYTSAAETQDGHSVQLDLGGLHYLKKGRSLGIALGLVDENPKDATLGYQEQSVTLSGGIDLPGKGSQALRPELRFHWRDYDQAEVGKVLREDRQASFSLSWSRMLFAAHRIELKAKLLSNDSTDSANHYRKQVYSLAYNVSF